MNLPLESVVKVKGTVLSRPSNMINKKQATGEIEVLIEDCLVLNKASEQLPFNIREFQKANETKRIKYRYLDMRFPVMQRNLRMRSMVLMKMREFLINECDFIEVETPTLFRATPGVKYFQKWLDCFVNFCYGFRVHRNLLYQLVFPENFIH